MQIVTATELKRDMKKIFDTSINQHEPVIIKRPHGHDMAVVELAEYQSLKETAYLLGNQANAEHLAESIRQVKAGKVVEKKFKDLE